MKTAAFVVLALTFAFRAPRAASHPPARLAWAAIGVGAAALLTLGTVIPQPLLDSLFGGTNVLKLIQVLLATAAFWLVAQAGLAIDRRNRPMKLWVLFGMLLAITLAFCGIPTRGDTDALFLENHIGFTAAWMMATLYMGYVVYIALRLLVGTRRASAWPIWFMRAGAVAVIAASLVEIVALTLHHFGVLPAIADTGEVIFNGAFYPGIVGIVLGVALFTARRAILERHVRQMVPRLRLGLEHVPQFASITRDESLGALYELVISARDYETARGQQLDSATLDLVRAAESLLNKQFSDPLLAGLTQVTTYKPKR